MKIVALLVLVAVLPPTTPDRPMASAPNAREVLGPPAGAGWTGEALEQKTHQVAALLRCPVCQGLSVADSPAAMALNMKRQVRDLLSWGYSEEQILRYFESSYGQFVRLEPPRRGINLLVWLGPLLALIGGGFLIALTMRRYRSRRSTVSPAAHDPGLDRYLEQVRVMANGETPEKES
jgi:cytochrome c-type biogenesis protein CcmH